MEEKIMDLEARKDEIEQHFSDPEFYKKHAPELKALQSELNALTSDLDNLYARWDELESIKKS